MFGGKNYQKIISLKGHRANNFLELVHSDVCGPFNVQALGGHEYFVTFIDDCSRYGYVYLMYHKYETSEKFKEFQAWMQN